MATVIGMYSLRYDSLLDSLLCGDTVITGWLRVNIWDNTFTLHLGQKDRTAPRFAHSRVRECGTSGHAAAH